MGRIRTYIKACFEYATDEDLVSKSSSLGVERTRSTLNSFAPVVSEICYDISDVKDLTLKVLKRAKTAGSALTLRHSMTWAIALPWIKH